MSTGSAMAANHSALEQDETTTCGGDLWGATLSKEALPIQSISDLPSSSSLSRRVTPNKEMLVAMITTHLSSETWPGWTSIPR